MAYIACYWKSKSKSKLCYDWRSVGQSILVSAPIWGPKPDFYYCQRVVGLLMWGALSDERTGLSFTFAAGPRQPSHFLLRVPRDSLRYFTVSDSRLPQPGGPGFRIYIPLEQGVPVVPPGNGFLFRRLLRLARPRWKHSNPPTRDDTENESKSYITIDGRSAVLSLNKAPIWSLRPDFYSCQTVAGLLMWGSFSDERASLSFTIATGLRQSGHFRVRFS
jgi:hypothetical protein